MNPVVYRPPDILRWFDLAAKQSAQEARDKGRTVAALAGESKIIPTIKEAAGVAISIGKGAFGGLVQRQAEETRYDLHDAGIEVVDLTRRIKVDYSQIREIVPKGGDKFVVLFNGGSFNVKPVAHLVAGKYKVPVGWLRNGVEVPFLTLVEELAARSQIDIGLE